MSKGLMVMLDKIRTRPDSETLFQRFLVLVAELTDETEKVRFLLDLAEVLSPLRPRTAIEICHQVYQNVDVARTDARAAEIRSLAIIRQCLIRLGRPGKAEVVRIELTKLSQEQVPQFKDTPRDKTQIAAVYDGEFPSTGVVTATEPTAVESSGSAQRPVVEFSASGQRPIVETSVSGHRRSLVSEMGLVDFSSGRELRFVAPQGENRSGRTLATPTPLVKIPEPSLTSSSPVKKTSEPSIIPQGLPVPPPVEGKDEDGNFTKNPAEFRLREVSRTDVQPFFPSDDGLEKSVNEPAVVAEERAFIAEANIVMFWQPLHEYLTPLVHTTDVAEILEHLRSTAKRDGWVCDADKLKFICEHLTGKKSYEDDAWRRTFTDALWFHLEPEIVRSLLKAAGLLTLAVQLWGYYLDLLLGSRRYRRALAAVREAITPGLSLEWATEAYKRLPDIWRGLGFLGFDWDETQGTPVLCDKLSRRNGLQLKAIVTASSS